MKINSKDYVLVIGSKPLSRLPNINVSKVYCANGAAERCLVYKKYFPNSKTTSVVSASEFNKRLEIRDRIISLKPDNLYCRFGILDKSLMSSDLLKKINIFSLGKFKQFIWQAKFYKYGILTLFFSELAYEKKFFKKIKHFYDCLRWRGFLCSSTGLYSILLAHLENPKSTILVSGVIF